MNGGLIKSKKMGTLDFGRKPPPPLVDWIHNQNYNILIYNSNL